MSLQQKVRCKFTEDAAKSFMFVFSDVRYRSGTFSLATIRVAAQVRISEVMKLCVLFNPYPTNVENRVSS